MALKVVWTPEAAKSLDQIIRYLEQNWSEKEVVAFIQKTEHVIELVSNQPYLFPLSKKRTIRKALITKHNSLFYKIDKTINRLILISFWDNRKNPKNDLII
jgi:plasmid stabilization system protein ParE